jgi:hypothetical protein
LDGSTALGAAVAADAARRQHAVNAPSRVRSPRLLEPSSGSKATA